MRAEILERLARFASRDVQRRFIVRGTKDEYLVPEELVNDIFGIERLLTPSQDEFSPSGLQCLLRFLETFRDVSDELLVSNEGSAEDLIEHDPAWDAVRRAAAECLDCLGFDLQEWERKELQS